MRAADFVQSYFDAWNHSDAKGVAEHLAKDGTYHDVPTNQQHSREDLVANLADFFAYEQHSYQLIGEILASDNSIAFQYRMSSLDQSHEDWFGAEFMMVNGDGAVKITDYYDHAHTVRPIIAKAGDTTTPKYAKSGLDSSQLEDYSNKLTSLMTGDKVYLEAELTMPKLAKLVKCSVNHLSQAVNSGFGMSFFDFLNSYRIEEAKAMLSQSKPQSQAILDISFAVGFNSNSAFYAAFKKATGQTPAQYRRVYLAENGQA